MKLKVSKKYIISINEFMYNFLNVSYKGKNKLTHKEMNRYLYEKEKIVLNVIGFKKIKTESILRGNCILVKDVTGKILAYDNPKKLDKEMLEALLNNQKNPSEKETFNNIEKVKTKALKKH